jgi:hypothetical protein
MVFKKLILAFFLSLFIVPAFGQGVTVTGKVLDAKDNSSIIQATVLLISNADTSQKNGTVTDADGNFSIGSVAPGTYKLRAIYLGYNTASQNVTVGNSNVNVGSLKLSATANELKSVTVEGKQIRAEQLGDTSQFRADAYKTHPDATAEDLVTKMPGVTSDQSGVKVNGETVQQVYVDGKPFFGSDPTLALKNLPSEVIDKVQFFDKQSDQSSFTGFDDGNSVKTMNIVTKKNKSEGQFGKLYAGYGTDDRYTVGGNFNTFNGDQRISIIGLSNNINQQNFSSQDILGVTGGSGSNRGGMGGRGAFGGGGGGGGGANNFLVGQQNGITKTNSVGINYTDMWGKKIKVTASYFFNNTDNVTNTQLSRNYFADSNLVYDEKDYSETKNYNHRFNLRFEYNIDSFNAIIFTPNISFQKNNSYTTTSDTSFLAGVMSSNSNNSTSLNNSGYSFSDNLLYQHKFKKKGRTVSINIGTSANEKTGNGTYYSQTQYMDPATTNILDQHYTLYNNSYTVSSNITYTEPLGKKSQLMANYYPSYTKGIADKETDTLSPLTNVYTDLDTTLSNKYNSTYITQRGGLSYRYGTRKVNLMLGANVQYATLSGDETFPAVSTINKNFTNVLPTGFFNYRFADGRNLRIMYRTNISAPSITQLQDVVDVSNPLLLKTGNPNLKQDFEQTLIIRYGLTKSKTARNFFLFAYANYISDYIGNATYIPTKDSTVKYGIPLNRGSQITLPVNLNGYFNGRMFITYSLPADFLKSNFNINGGFNFTRTPGIVNDVVNYSNDYAPSLGLVLSSNISQNVDFTLAYFGNYNIVNNTIQTQSNNNYYNHTVSFKINYIFLKHFVFNTDITNTYYSTLTSKANTENFYLWDAYVAYKMLKNNALEARISAFDILNQNKSVTRTVTDTYVENNVTQVLRQYFMFTLTYTLRNFKGGATMPQDNSKDRPDYPGMHGGHGGFGGPSGGGPGGGM